MTVGTGEGVGSGGGGAEDVGAPELGADAAGAIWCAGEEDLFKSEGPDAAAAAAAAFLCSSTCFNVSFSGAPAAGLAGGALAAIEGGVPADDEAGN